MTRTRLLSAITLLAACTFAANAIPQSQATSEEASVVTSLDATSRASLTGELLDQRAPVLSTYGYPWSQRDAQDVIPVTVERH